jgi:hypothetical protein
MLRIRAALVFVVAAACDRSAPLSVEPDANVTRSPNAPLQVVTGGGEVDVTSVFPGAPNSQVAFTARLDGDGVASGELEAHFSVPDESIHMDVSCLAVSGNEAWLGGVVTRSHPTGVFLDRVFIIRVQDNGQGEHDPPDRMSHFRGGLTPARCLNKPVPVNGEFDLHFPFVHGNVQIR